MSQNLLDLQFSPEQLAEVDAALAVLETVFVDLLSLQPDERQSITKMGDKSEPFCRQTLMALEQNPQVVPPSLGLADAQADVVALDQLRPRLARLQRLTERAVDSETALGGDIMSTALEGYALLKVSGKNQGLEGLREALSARFGRRTRRSGPAPT